ncbi:centromere protein 3 [Staphylotrichum tortipilum]|uniref:CENP-C homolog n=1 Tax=Staphylotrichum tortipilum TaxID=2831512 RepID=A0AAN6MCS5_9PEZI|nr:centromere protein 3 [Staphylotrichum longicolle]
MAPRQSMARRTLQGEHIYELGVVGRKTGLTVPDSGMRDEHGMEPIEHLFSSPVKSDHEGQEEEEEDEYGSGEEAMDITTTSGIGPAALLNGYGSRLPVSLSRVRSPAKTFLNSPAQRNRLVAQNSSSPARGAIVRDESSRSSSQPTGLQASAKRRLDFKSVANGGPHSLSQPLAGSRVGAGKGLANGHRLQLLQRDDDDDEEGAQSGESDYGGEDDEVNDFVEESMAMLHEGDDYGVEEADPEQGQGGDEEDEASASEEEASPAPVARKKLGRSPKQKAAVPAKATKPQKKPVRPVEEEDEVDDQQEEEEEEEEPTPKSQKPTAGRRGGASKAEAAQPVPAAQARGSKKRRSQDDEASAAAAQPPQQKRQRTSPAPTTIGVQKPAPKKPAAKTAAPAAKPPRRPRKSSIDPGDVSQVAIARRPPLPKSRGLLINRREVPGEAGSSMHRTRSGRTSFKPLAYWRNERVEFDKDEAEDAFAGRTHKSKFVLSRIKEVVRVDEPEPELKPRSRRGKKAGGAAAAGKRGRRRRSGGADDDDDGDGPAEMWELDPGTVTGEVVVWQPEYEFNPPAPNDMVSVIDKQLAISGAAIKTADVVGGQFRYAKVISEGFIGAGVVDLPPGAVKRLKNARKVFMIFFVHAGRVLVTVQETSFRISKGGIFIVPRYNEYMIENDYDNPARIFFAQGQEIPMEVPPEDETGEVDEDVDEEVEVSEGEEEEEEGSEEE